MQKMTYLLLILTSLLISGCSKSITKPKSQPAPVEQPKDVPPDDDDEDDDDD